MFKLTAYSVDDKFKSSFNPASLAAAMLFLSICQQNFTIDFDEFD